VLQWESDASTYFLSAMSPYTLMGHMKHMVLTHHDEIQRVLSITSALGEATSIGPVIGCVTIVRTLLEIAEVFIASLEGLHNSDFLCSECRCARRSDCLSLRRYSQSASRDQW
jgi:hypothetical protein